MNVTPALTLVRRELLRFIRERSRMIGVIASPVLFWIVIGSGMNKSFQQPGGDPSINYLEYFFPGSVVLVILFASIFSSISVIEDRREGFMQSVLVAPISRTSIVLGKVLGITLLATIQGALLLLASPLVIEHATVGAMCLALLMMTVIALGLSSFGFAIAWVMDSTQGFHAIMNLLFVPMWMLSGALFPSTGASGWISALMDWNPLTYGVAAVRQSLYGLQPAHGTGLPGFGLSSIVLILFAVATFVAATWVMNRRPAGSPMTEGKGAS